MSGAEAPHPEVPLDPTFPPAAYVRVARLLRTGVIGFFVLAAFGMVLDLVQHPSLTLAQLLATNPGPEFTDLGRLLTDFASGGPTAIIIVGVYIMVAVTVLRVVYATVDFYRGRERILAAVSAAVVLLLLLGLFVVAPLVA